MNELIDALRTVGDARPDRLTECRAIIQRLKHGNSELAADRARRLIRETLGVIGTDDPRRAELEAAAAGYDPEYRRTEPPTVREILFRSGMTQAQLAQRFGIPKRTIENWSTGVRVPPEYVVNMMIEILFDVRCDD